MMIKLFGILVLALGVGVQAKDTTAVRGTRRASFELTNVLNDISSSSSNELGDLDLLSLTDNNNLGGLDLTSLSDDEGEDGDELNSLLSEMNFLTILGKKSGSGSKNNCKNRPTSLTLRYQSAGQNSQFQDANKATCRAGNYPSPTTVTVNGQSFSVQDGTEFTVTLSGGANTDFNVGGRGSCTIHTSCSAPIIGDDQIGPFVIIGANGGSGGPGFDYCCNVAPPLPTVPPPPPNTPPTVPPPTEAPTPVPPTPSPTVGCPPFDEICPLVRPEPGSACRFFGDCATPPELYQELILNRQMQTIVDPVSQAVPRAGCKFPYYHTRTEDVELFCVCAIDNLMTNPLTCGRTICEEVRNPVPTLPPTDPPTDPPNDCNPTNVCPIERPPMGDDCNWSQADLCRYDQCGIPNAASGLMPTHEYLCKCICDDDSGCGKSFCELNPCPQEAQTWCPIKGITVYNEDFQDAMDTSSQWSNGKTTTIENGRRRFLGPYSDGEERPCREFSFRPFDSGMARISFDLYEYELLDRADKVGVYVGDEYNGVCNGQTLLAALIRPSGMTSTEQLSVSWNKHPDDSKLYHFEVDISREYLYVNNWDVFVCMEWELMSTNELIGFDNIVARFCPDYCDPEPCCALDQPEQNFPCDLRKNVVCGYNSCGEDDPLKFATQCRCVDGRYQCKETNSCGGGGIDVLPTFPPSPPTFPPPPPPTSVPNQMQTAAPTRRPTLPPTRPPTLAPTTFPPNPVPQTLPPTLPPTNPPTTPPTNPQPVTLPPTIPPTNPPTNVPTPDVIQPTFFPTVPGGNPIQCPATAPPSFTECTDEGLECSYPLPDGSIELCFCAGGTFQCTIL
mmetsp:Transcript_3902/g.6137  ORF Transcript_3902/g.6137 Transcript_3902/m.6137 type:complete len:843 (-) Transcript_3902:159-2687(-)|eukprot:CAMPEP_0178912240 /NCGR_PEP_ID=MMETSP0786-20121207/10149_1 /TAXON_ID=186022 /ORGANISM="Thalassionema frauenfeldii, Strain CCMP 1798" /LENGTH=842 /DNA_ID=CAMNT_0020584793 /DNA_START=128 /DNA_END=2656 /DNA_ORIENTATION=-